MDASSGIGCAKPSVDTWMDHGAGLIGGALYSIMRTRLGEIGVQFALNDATSSTIYSWLRTRAPEIEAAFSEPLNWHDPAGARTSLVEVRRRADISDRTSWPECFEWLRTRLETFQLTLWPIVGRVPPAGVVARRWDESSFFAELEQFNPPGVDPARFLLAWARESGMNLVWGRGRRFGSCMPRFVHGGQPYEPVSIWTNGVVLLRFVDLRKAPPWNTPQRRLDLLKRFNTTPHFSLPGQVIDMRPALPLPLLDAPSSMASFCAALEWFGDTSRAFRHR